MFERVMVIRWCRSTCVLRYMMGVWLVYSKMSGFGSGGRMVCGGWYIEGLRF